MSTNNFYAPETFNLHTHTALCKHASGSVEDYTEEAISQGMLLLGFADHCPLPDNNWASTRMDFSQYPEYLDAIEVSKEKHQSDIVILKGFECDYLKKYDSFFREELLASKQCDFLITGTHYVTLIDGSSHSVYGLDLTKKELHGYTDDYISALESGLFLFGAHPDLFLMSYRAWDDEAMSCARAIIECAVSSNIPLEINGYGLRKPLIDTPQGPRKAYPVKEFWDLAAQYPLLVTCNSDAHRPQDVHIHYEVCKSFADQSGISFCKLQTYPLRLVEDL